MKQRKKLRKKLLVNVKSKGLVNQTLDEKKSYFKKILFMIIGNFLSGIAKEAGAKTYSSPKFTEIWEQIVDNIGNFF